MSGIIGVVGSKSGIIGEFSLPGRFVGFSTAEGVGNDGNYVTVESNKKYSCLLFGVHSWNPVNYWFTEVWTVTVNDVGASTFVEHVAWTGSFSITGGTNTIRFENSASANYYNGCMLVFEAGSNVDVT